MLKVIMAVAMVIDSPAIVELIHVAVLEAEVVPLTVPDARG